MKNILFLLHRIPYPPNKGDKIRSYHFLRGLAEEYNIYLATFVDEPNDWQYVTKVEKYTHQSLFIKLNPFFAKIKSLSGLIVNKPLSLPYYQTHQLQNWVDMTIKEKKIDKVFIFSSVMVQYVQKYNDLEVIIDFVDVDSDKWLQYSQKAKWPMSWVYKREAKKLLEFDENVAKCAKTSIFVSQEEANLFERLVEVDSKQINFVNNGVDTHYFNPEIKYETPYNIAEKIIVFTGAMDYWANVDAVCWFVRDVFPIIKQQCKNVQFYIVGSSPTKEVLNLANTQGVLVTGRVEDIRPFLFYAQLVVAPLKIARGIQNKVLEAMAMGKKIVATPQAIEGIRIGGQEVFVAENAEDFAYQVLSSLSNISVDYYAEKARKFVIENHSWAANLQRLTEIIECKENIKVD